MVAVVSADLAAVTAEVLSEACNACAVLQKHDKTEITHRTKHGSGLKHVMNLLRLSLLYTIHLHTQQYVCSMVRI